VSRLTQRRVSAREERTGTSARAGVVTRHTVAAPGGEIGVVHRPLREQNDPVDVGLT
jgi:hypothetical protein